MLKAGLQGTLERKRLSLPCFSSLRKIPMFKEKQKEKNILKGQKTYIQIDIICKFIKEYLIHHAKK